MDDTGDNFGVSLASVLVSPQVLTVRVGGELDMLTGPQLDDYVRSRITSAVDHVILDLAEVTFLGSSALSVLAGLARDGIGAQLHLTGVRGNRMAQRPLELTGLTSLFDIDDDLAALQQRLQRKQEK